MSLIDPDQRPARDRLFASLHEAGILGRVEVWRDVAAAKNIKPRDIFVWLPTAYDAQPDRRLPVLYMHDGHNVIDPRFSTWGIDWGIDETIERLAAAGTIEPRLVVAPFCTEDRRAEYSPHHQGPDYAAWLLDELKPRVDATFRTRPGRDDTAVMGSSMGGLISLHIALTYPHLVAQAGCVSTHWVWEDAQYLRDLEATPPPHTGASPFLYFDFGTVGVDEPYPPLQARADAALVRAGWRPDVDFVTRRFEGAEHSEAAWRARLDSIVTHLFGPR